MENAVRLKFDKKTKKLLSNKRTDNSAFMTADEYKSRIAAVKRAKEVLQTRGSKKSVKEYRLVRKFDVLTVENEERLIRPVGDDNATILYYVKNEQLYDVLHEAHLAVSHGGRNRMKSELKKRYCNVTNEAIMVYLKLCVSCREKYPAQKRSFLEERSASDSRAQFDLIDMQSLSYDDFRFIMVYRDHFANFVIFRALKFVDVETVAAELVNIYTTFGAPVILHSNSCREFISAVLDAVHALWDGVKVVRGKPCHTQSRRANEEIEDLVADRIDEKQDPNWPAALKFIQFQKNCASHSGIQRAPYEAMFGCSKKVGLLSIGLPQSAVANLTDESDMEQLLNTKDDDSAVPSESSRGVLA